MSVKSNLSTLLNTLRSATDRSANDLAGLRARIADCERLIGEAEQAPADPATIGLRCRVLVDEVIATVRARGGLLDVLALPHDRFNPNTASVSAETIKSFEFACLLSRDAAIAGLTREAIAAGSDSGLTPLSDDQRNRIIEKLSAEARGLAASEELLIRQLEASGLSAARRVGADPSVLLAPDAELRTLADA
ncbi:MAG: hypothetical protein K2Z25_15375 [Beijerinckiaceae bacterium]|nr:hypothetical protein [Beijerinckiaceae bacterium]